MASMANDEDSPMSMKEFCSAWVDVAGMGFQLAVWKITAHLPHGLKRAIVGTITIALPSGIAAALIRFLIHKQDVRDWTED